VSLRVIGLGSPHGDDAIGLAVAQRLAREALPAQVEVRSCERPGVDLLEALQGASAAVLVDAVRCGSTPGSVVEIDPASLRGGVTLSSHGLGVAEALALGRALHRLPDWLRVVGIEIATAEGEGLSPAVAAAVGPACRRVRALVESWHADPLRSDGGG
jgi:hydrogenase maturation protease